MKYLTQITVAGVYITAMILVSGCRTGPDVTYLDPKSNESKIVRVGSIDQQDWGFAATKMTDSLMRSGVLDKPKQAGKKNVIMISRIQNKTAEHVDIDLLVKKMRTSVLRSGKALTTTAVRAGGAEDPASMKTRKELRGNEEFDQSTVAKKGKMLAPHYSLSGKIIQSNARAGRVSQATFTFQLSLTDIETGLAVWEDEFEIVKQGKKKAAVGW